MVVGCTSSHVDVEAYIRKESVKVQMARKKYGVKLLDKLLQLHNYH